MALTTHDLDKIKIGMADVIEPRFADTNRRIDHTNNQIKETKLQIEQRFGQLKGEIDTLTAATNRKFHAVFTDVSIMREDLYVVKQMVTEHGFRIAHLENQPRREER